MMNLIAVRTKTGKKVHLASSRSSRTLCGARVAAALKTIGQGALPCGGCGMAPEMTAETIAEWLGMKAV